MTKPTTDQIGPAPSCLSHEPDQIDFGEVPSEIDALLQEGVAAYRHDKAAADRLFRQALARAPEVLPVYFCLYKIHTYQGNLDDAEAAAKDGMAEAARQAGWPVDWRHWTPRSQADGPGRFAFYTLKALAFIRLRQNDKAAATEILSALARLDPAGHVGWPVIAALAEGLS